MTMQLCVDGVFISNVGTLRACVDGVGAQVCADGTIVYELAAVVVLAPPILVTSPAIPDGTVGTAFTYTPINTGGAATSYSATGLPPGVTINTTTGVLSGTVTAAGTYTIAITATNADGADTFTDTMVVAAALAPPNIATSVAFPAATVGTAYNWPPTNTGGAPTSYTLQSGALPAGLTLNPLTGVISGTPTVAGTFAITVRASNAAGTSDFAGSIVSAPTAIALTPAGVPSALYELNLFTEEPCFIDFNSDGSIFTQSNVFSDPTGTWTTVSAGVGALFEINVVQTVPPTNGGTFGGSGSLTGITGGFIPLNPTRKVMLSTVGILSGGEFFAEVTVTIRQIGLPSNSMTLVLDIRTGLL